MAWVSMSRFGTYPPSLSSKEEPYHTALSSFLSRCPSPGGDVLAALFRLTVRTLSVRFPS